MTTRPAELQPCVHKGCPWRGADPHACPLHEDNAWDRQHPLMTEAFASKRQTRHRR
jgi:hypothetical protein